MWNKVLLVTISTHPWDQAAQRLTNLLLDKVPPGQPPTLCSFQVDSENETELDTAQSSPSPNSSKLDYKTLQMFGLRIGVMWLSSFTVFLKGSRSHLPKDAGLVAAVQGKRGQRKGQICNEWEDREGGTD